MSEQLTIFKNPLSNNKSGVRKRAFTISVVSTVALLILLIAGFIIETDSLVVNFDLSSLAPSFSHPFGTDWLGRDMFLRTIKGLSISFWVGILSAFISVIVALLLSLLVLINKQMDTLVTSLIDIFLGVPHLVILILISFMLGGGMKGVIIALSLTHWPKLARLLRAEILQIKDREYIIASKNLGKSRFWIARNHIFPHLTSQLLIGFILMFPHAILHEASITFLGLGLSADQPAIGIILSESMSYLSSGMWWLALFPGFMLLLMVAIFDSLGHNIKRALDPFNGKKN